jgi:hypothetical protein
MYILAVGILLSRVLVVLVDPNDQWIEERYSMRWCEWGEMQRFAGRVDSLT